LGLIDTHSHLYLDHFDDDLPAVLVRAWDSGVTKILIPGIDLNSSRAALDLAESDPRIFASVGVHPNDALTWDDSTYQHLKTLAQQPKVVAVGEIGLDYYRDRAPKELQIRILEQQLALAEECGLPVIIHNRQAVEDLWPILQSWQAHLTLTNPALAARPGVLHAYDGQTELGQAAVKANFFLSVGGPITYKSAQSRYSSLAELPLTSLLLETDAPFLPPHPYRGKRNEPAYLTVVANQLAEILQRPAAEIVGVTQDNANRLFAWGTTLEH